VVPLLDHSGPKWAHYKLPLALFKKIRAQAVPLLKPVQFVLLPALIIGQR